MKNGVFAVYRGRTYSADIIKGKGVVLRSNDSEDLKKGFEVYPVEDNNGEKLYVKFVDKKDLDEFYRIKTFAFYHGYKFEVDCEKEGMVSIISMIGDYRIWENLGMKCIDRGVYQKWVRCEEVKFEEEKINKLTNQKTLLSRQSFTM